MSQREYEQQPEAPDLGEFVQEESAETLVGPPGTDALDAGYVPPDRPYGLDDPRAGAPAGAEPEGLDERLNRERPEVELAESGGGDLGDEGRSGRLETSDAGADGEYIRSMEGRDVGIDGGGASAEEAAVHYRGEDEVGIVGQPDD